MRTDVEYLEFLWPMRHYLITCGDLLAGTANIIRDQLLHAGLERAATLRLRDRQGRVFL
jgi:hypothetical protein